MYHQYNNRLCKANLPQYLRNIEGIKDVRNLASYEISSSLLEFDNTNISYELNLISENEEEIDFENYELWKTWGLITAKENELYFGLGRRKY